MYKTKKSDNENKLYLITTWIKKKFELHNIAMVQPTHNLQFSILGEKINKIIRNSTTVLDKLSIQIKKSLI